MCKTLFNETTFRKEIKNKSQQKMLKKNINWELKNAGQVTKVIG